MTFCGTWVLVYLQLFFASPLFSEAKRTDVYEIVNFETTFNLVEKLIGAEDA